MFRRVTNGITNDRQVPLFRLIWNVLTSRERRGLVGIVVLIFVGMVLELFSLALVIPAVGLLTQDNYADKYPRIVAFIGDPSGTTLIVGGLILLFVVYLVKGGFMLLSVWVQRGFSVAIGIRLRQQMFEHYLSQRYVFHLENNSAMLIRNVQNSTSVLTGGVDPFLILLTDGLVAIGMVCVLLVVEPIGTLIVLLLFVAAGLIFQKTTRARLARWGEEGNLHSGMALKYLQEGLGGIKDVKMLGREQKFLDDHGAHTIATGSISRRYAFMQTLPRVWLEILTVGSLAVLVSSLVIQGKPLSSILPVLGLFAATAFRVMPSINKIIASFQTLRYSEPVIRLTYCDLVESRVTSPIRSGPIGFNSEISFDKVTFNYPNSELVSLKDASLVVNKGETIGIVGSSGAGKTTLVDILLGLLEPTSGRVIVDGRDIHENVQSWQRQIGYVPQSIYLIDNSLRRNISFGLPDEEIDEEAVRRAVESAQLGSFISQLPEGLETIVGERGVRLSGGQRQRIGIARALYADPSILVLDEATSSLDGETEKGFLEAISCLKGTKTIIMVAHRLSTLEQCDRVYRLEDAIIVHEGSLHEVTNVFEWRGRS